MEELERKIIDRGVKRLKELGGLAIRNEILSRIENSDSYKSLERVIGTTAKERKAEATFKLLEEYVSTGRIPEKITLGYSEESGAKRLKRREQRAIEQGAKFYKGLDERIGFIEKRPSALDRFKRYLNPFKRGEKMKMVQRSAKDERHLLYESMDPNTPKRLRELSQMAGERLFHQISDQVKRSTGYKNLEKICKGKDGDISGIAWNTAIDFYRQFLDNGEFPDNFVMGYENEDGAKPLTKKEQKTLVESAKYYEEAPENITLLSKKRGRVLKENKERKRRDYFTLGDDFGFQIKSMVKQEQVAVSIYNSTIRQHKKSGRFSTVQKRYNIGSAIMGIEVDEYKDLLRTHLKRTLENYVESDRGVSGRANEYGSRTVLERFDKDLIEYNRFVEDATTLYKSSDLSLKKIADNLAERYGMRISVSHLSKIARDKTCAKSRKEAKTAYQVIHPSDTQYKQGIKGKRSYQQSEEKGTIRFPVSST